MDEKLYEELIRSIKSYYPISTDNRAILEKVVEDKILNLDSNLLLKALCDQLSSLGTVEDFSYTQFPSLKIYLEEIEEFSHLRTYKNFAICISLLGPYYTFFYEYDFRIKTEEGFLTISKICFLKDDKFKFLTRNLNLEHIDNLIRLNYPSHSFVDHQLLIENKIEFGLPYGKFDFGDTRYSIMEYLFDPTRFNHCFR